VPRAVLSSSTQRHIQLDAASIRGLAEFVLEAEGAPAELEVSIAVVDDAAIAALNARHLNRDEPTDVLAFPMSEQTPAADQPSAEAGPSVLGDVVISAERAIAYCRAHGGDPLEELSLYLVHGLLHLLGYDDVTEAARRRMRARERELMRRAAAAGLVLRGRLVHTDR
jgi:probable rRNA maturation factor